MFFKKEVFLIKKNILFVYLKTFFIIVFIFEKLFSFLFNLQKILLMKLIIKQIIFIIIAGGKIF